MKPAIPALALLLSTVTLNAADTAWLQWGGPRRNFTVDTAGLASTWPATGPRRLWNRTLGEGHSAIVVDGNRLYTMYRPSGMLTMVRRSQQETVGALDAATGKTIWEVSEPHARASAR